MSKKKRGIKNIRERLVIVALFAVIVLSFLLIYFSQVKADSVVAGTATAELKLYVNVSSAKNISVTANFVPTNGGTKLAATREFTFLSAGLHEAVWKVRKLPQGKYKVHLLTGSEFFQPGRNVTLNVEQINDAGKYMYYDDGTTVAKYKSQWWPLAYTGTNGVSSGGSSTNPDIIDCGSSSYSDNSKYGNPFNDSLNLCFYSSFEKCEAAKVILEGEQSLFKISFEIVGPESNLCRVKGSVISAGQKSEYYKLGQSLSCKLDSDEGFDLSLQDAITDYHNKYNFQLSRTEDCSGTLFDSFKKVYSNNKSAGTF